MWKPLLLAVLCSATLLSTDASAQILATLTPEQIDEAIALGTKPKDARRLLQRYGLRPRALGGNGPIVAIVTTPYTRVVALALEAHEKYETVTAADLPADALLPEVRVHAGPRRRFARGRPDDLANVRAIALTPHKSKDRSEAILPTRSEEVAAKYSNLFGAEWEGVGMAATFPASRFLDGLDVHIVFDAPIEIAGLSRCDDCRIEIKTAGWK